MSGDDSGVDGHRIRFPRRGAVIIAVVLLVVGAAVTVPCGSAVLSAEFSVASDPPSAEWGSWWPASSATGR
ncbi:hypothetical protein [Microlunatus soli]|uniref:hypothetical protein n=1 Tax=Microlunatus soli TaxID=630515 RepID=UPI0012FA5171|nr:hypothetical protein [Microlunatus soli]